MLVFGTRPETIKMCPVVNELKTRENICTIICVTGQHRQMLDQVLEAFQVVPDVVLVGDTSTTFVTSLACFYCQISVGHVEAGLHTYDIYSPYSEVFNRQAVGIVAK